MKHKFLELDHNKGLVDCERCGHRYMVFARALYRPRAWWICNSCQAKPTKVIATKGDHCRPWQGEIDLDTMQPIRDGKPFMPGERICGNSDCVRSSHIKTSETSS